jgi:hypothetical protein
VVRPAAFRSRLTGHVDDVAAVLLAEVDGLPSLLTELGSRVVALGGAWGVGFDQSGWFSGLSPDNSPDGRPQTTEPC